MAKLLLDAKANTNTVHPVFNDTPLQRAIENNNTLAKSGFLTCGVHLFNPNWVEQNGHKMNFSIAYSIDDVNEEIANIAIENNLSGRQEAKDVSG